MTVQSRNKWGVIWRHFLLYIGVKISIRARSVFLLFSLLESFIKAILLLQAPYLEHMEKLWQDHEWNSFECYYPHSSNLE